MWIVYSNSESRRGDSKPFIIEQWYSLKDWDLWKLFELFGGDCNALLLILGSVCEICMCIVN